MDARKEYDNPCFVPSLPAGLDDLCSSCAKDPYDVFAPTISLDSAIHESVTSIHLTESVEAPDAYNHVVDALLQASEEDLIFLHINTEGGSLDSADRLAHAIRTSSAFVVGVATGTVASAGTLIFLACDEYRVSQDSTFLFHGGEVSFTDSKFHDIKAYCKFHEKHLDGIIERHYRQVLTSTEISNLKAGEEVWLTGIELAKRCNVTVD